MFLNGGESQNSVNRSKDLVTRSNDSVTRSMSFLSKSENKVIKLQILVSKSVNRNSVTRTKIVIFRIFR
jgi:hypothetical protein